MFRPSATGMLRKGHAGVLELADNIGSNPIAARRVGSNPTSRTTAAP